jgi:PAS domain S-box-containing protein
MASAILRKRSNNELADQRAFLRQVLDINPSFVFARDREGRFTLVNQAVAEAYGTTVDGLIGRTDADFNPNAEEVAAFRRDDLEVMEAGPEEVITDAPRRWPQTGNGRSCADGAAHQVSASRRRTMSARAEEALAASESAIAASSESLRVLHQPARWDPAGMQLRSPGCGLRSAAAARGSDVPSTRTQDRESLLERLGREGGIRDHEVELRRLDGSPAFVRMNLVGSFEGKTLSEVKGYLVDITEQRRLEVRLAAQQGSRHEDS